MTSPEVTSISTQVTPIDLMIMNNLGTQCNIKPPNYSDNDKESQTECESSDSDESEYHQSASEYDDDSSSDTHNTDSGRMPSKSAFVVYWSSLMILLKTRLTCSLLETVMNVTVKGSQLIVALTCTNNHEDIWKSKLTINRYSQGNLTLSAAVLFSAKTFERIAKYFDIANIQWITKTSYYAIQRNILAGVVHLNYFRMNGSLVRNLKRERECKLSGKYFIRLVKTNRLKICRNGKNLYKIIFGGPLQLVKGAKNFCVKNGSAFYFLFKIYTNGEPVNSLRNVKSVA